MGNLSLTHQLMPPILLWNRETRQPLEASHIKKQNDGRIGWTTGDFSTLGPS